MNLPKTEWLSPAAALCSALLLLLWMLRYIRVMKPRRGTLEWIRRADRGRFPPFSLQPLRAKGWIVLAASLLLGLGKAMLNTEFVFEGQTLAIAVSVGQSLVCALLLLLLFGAPVPAFCGTLLITAAGSPPLLLLLIALLLLLSLSCRDLLRQLGLLIPALFLLFLFVGCGFPSLVLLVSYFVLHLLCAGLREPRPKPGVLVSLLLLMVVAAAVFAVSSVLYRPFGTTVAEAILTEGKRLIEWKPAWLPHTSLPALLTALLIPVLLLQARLLRNTGWLFAALAALFGLQMALCGHPELSCLGGITVLTATFAGADRRGGRIWALVTTALLTVCIFIF